MVVTDAAALRDSVRADAAPSDLGPLLEALWHEANGDWNRAHRLVQDQSGADAAWVHAYLHRQEGDLSNARYWYGRAGREPSEDPAEQEWASIADALIASARAE